MTRAGGVENKFLFDHLYGQRDDIESSFGFPLEWLRLDDKKASRIQLRKEFDGYNREQWQDMIDWLVDHMIRLEKAFKSPLHAANEKLKNTTFDHGVEA